MTNLECTKLIDRYLSGEMTEEEKMSFERLLSEGDSSSIDVQNLQKEMELQQEIESAIQERGLREMLQNEEARIRHHKHVKRVTIWSLCSGSVITAIAAVMLLLLVVAPAARLMQDYSNQYVSAIEVNITRGDIDQNQSLDNALMLMQNGQWEEAEKLVDNIYQQAELNHENLQEIYYEAEWLKAVCLMHREKVIKAKRLLRNIAHSASPYSCRAKDLLNTL